MAIQLVKACIQSQNAFHADFDDTAMCHKPSKDPKNPCENKKPPESPDGYKRIGCFTGVNTYRGETQIECFGLVYHSKADSGTYIFSFRGSKSQLDWLEDFEFRKQDPFVPVLQCASTSPNGVCINDDVTVPWPTCAVVSFRPDPIQLHPILMEALGAPAVAGIDMSNADLIGCFHMPCIPPCTGPFGG